MASFKELIGAQKVKAQATAKELQAQLAYVQLQLENAQAQKDALKARLAQGEAAYQVLLELEAELVESMTLESAVPDSTGT